MKSFGLSLLVLCTIISISLSCDRTLQNLYVKKGSTPSIQFKLDVSKIQDVAYHVSRDDAEVLTVLFEINIVDISAPNVMFTGNLTTGDIRFEIKEIKSIQAGVYKLSALGQPDLQCQSVYVLGQPSSPTLSSTSMPEVGGSLNITCSSRSNTVPDDHGLTLIYTWLNYGQDIRVSNRFQYSGNTLIISSVQKTDKNASISCMATENITEGLTSRPSQDLRIVVHYGPENVILIPGNESYTVHAGDNFPNVKCQADCYPGCDYRWYKDSTFLTLSTTLVLGVLNDTDAAIYHCVVNRSVTVLRKSFKMNVIYGPSNMSPKEASVYDGDISSLISINCSSHCWECEYRWKGPENVPLQTEGGVLLLDKLVKSHKGTYTCTANNTRSFASDKTHVIVNVRYGPDAVTLNPEGDSHSVDEGGTLDNIVCHADCYPNCTYTWTKKYQKVAVTKNETLPFGSNIRKNYAGEYTCTASNIERQGTPNATATVSINVRYGPGDITLTPRGSSHIVNEGGYLDNITCSAQCFPNCTYVWEKQGNQSSVITGNTLRLGNNIQSEVSGIYVCSVTNPERSEKPTNKEDVIIYVRYGPKSLSFYPSHVEPLIVVEGQFLESITCSSDCFPNCSQIWKNGTEFTSKAAGGVLSLGNVTRYFSGRYHCLSTNDAIQYNKTANKSLELIVHYPPDANITIEYRDRDIILTCLAKGEPQNYLFRQWVHIAPDNTTEIQKYPGTKSVDRNILELKNVTYMDSGFYICKVSNNVTTASVQSGKADVEIKIEDKPHVIQDHQEIDAKISDNVSLTVRFYSNDPDLLNVTWYKTSNETTIKTDGKKYETSLTKENVTVLFYKEHVSQLGYHSQLDIRDIQEEDFNEYKVSIKNSKGIAVVRFYIIPTGPPEVPSEFQLVPGSQTTSSIVFTWLSGFHGGEDQTFHIEYSADGHEWIHGAKMPGGKLLKQQFQTSVTDLSAGTSYFFRIYASNIYGNSTKTVDLLVGNTTLLEKDVVQETEKGSAIGTAAGGTAVGIILVVICTLLVLFLLRRYNWNTACHCRERKSDTSEQPRLDYINMQTSIVDSAMDTTKRLDIARRGSMQYESLSYRKEEGSQYEELHAVNSLDSNSDTSEQPRLDYINMQTSIVDSATDTTKRLDIARRGSMQYESLSYRKEEGSQYEELHAVNSLDSNRSAEGMSVNIDTDSKSKIKYSVIKGENISPSGIYSNLNLMKE